MKTFLSIYFLPLLSGFLIGTSYIPFPPWAIFFSLVPLWLFALKQKKIRSLLIGAWLCQFTLTLIGFNWVAYTIKVFGFLPWPVAILGLLAFAALANLHIPLSLFFWFISKKYIRNIHPSLVLFALPLYSALCMYYYPMIFKWNLGYTWFYAGWPAAQTAEIWGFQFLSTLTLFSNLFALSLYLKYRERKYFVSCGILLSWSILFIALNIQGLILKKAELEPDKRLNVLMVQANNKNLQAEYRRTGKDPRPKAFNKLIEETEKYFKTLSPPSVAPDLILWPEGSYPYRMRYDGKKVESKRPQKLIKKWQTPLLISTSGDSIEGVTNSIFVFNKNGQLVQEPYHKSILLAFGEYFPGEKWLPISRFFSYYGRSFKRGTGENKVTTLQATALQATTLPATALQATALQATALQKISLGLQICYEGIFDFFTRNLVLEGAQILINVTNDSWYGSWQEPWQHLYMTLARAIEVRRPLIRGTNTGLSAFVSARGEIDYISNINTREYHLQEVSYLENPVQTLFTLWGFYINQAFLWTLFLGLLGNTIAFSFRRSNL